MTAFTVTRKGSEGWISPRDKVTAPEVPSLQLALQEEVAAGMRNIVFDMDETITLDSMGIGLLIAAHNSLAKAQGTLSLINLSPDLWKLLQSMRLINRLNAKAKEVSHG